MEDHYYASDALLPLWPGWLGAMVVGRGFLGLLVAGGIPQRLERTERGGKERRAKPESATLSNAREMGPKSKGCLWPKLAPVGVTVRKGGAPGLSVDCAGTNRAFLCSHCQVTMPGDL